MPTLTHLTHQTHLTLQFSPSDSWPATPGIEYLVATETGGWEPYLVVQPDLTGWDMYEVKKA